MAAYLIALGVALVSAAVVVVVANVLGDDRGQSRTFLRDLRSGLRRGRGGDRVPDAEPVDVDLVDLLEPRPASDDGYLQADELIDLWTRARDALPGSSAQQDSSSTTKS